MTAANLTESFQMNRKSYRTDARTLSVLRSIVPTAKAAKDGSAVCAVMTLGKMTGCIVETGPAKDGDDSCPEYEHQWSPNES